MAEVEKAPDQSGRIYSLTPEQTESLKEMWLQLLIASGHAPQDMKRTITTESVASSTKKKKGGVFGWRKKKVAAEDDKPEVQGEKLHKGLGKGLSSSELYNVLFTCVRSDNPDDLVLRYLRARKWDVAKGLFMFGETLYWRTKVENVENLFDTAEETADDEFTHQLKTGKSYIYGHDNLRRPVVHVRPDKHRPKEQSEKTMEKYVLYSMESTRLCLNGKVDTASVLFDMSKFTLACMDYHSVKFLVTCLEHHYPESLGVVIVHNAPFIFSGIWDIIKRWLDPVVASKIHFTKNTKDLKKFFPERFIPKDLGGAREWDYEYIPPVENENALKADTETRDRIIEERHAIFNKFIEATLDWIKATTPEETENLQKKKNEYADELRLNYWKLDPYIRGRIAIDRNGVLKSFRPEIEGGGENSA